MVQGTFDDLGTPLSSVTFVVVDLETTGGSPVECGITEIGAVQGARRRGRRRVPDPRQPGRAHPRLHLGAHRHHRRDGGRCAAHRGGPAGVPRVRHRVGARRAQRRLRHLLPQGRGAAAPSTSGPATRCSTPCTWPASSSRATRSPTTGSPPSPGSSGATTTPDHRALHDARATVDVLHGLLERVGSLGVHSLEELLDYTARVSPARRRKRHLADDLPDLPGVYLFKDGQGRVLYVGTSVSIRTRVRSYFTASEHRRRMGEMVRIAESVSPIVCATTLEAEVRELRLIAEHKPRYNRRSRHPERALWVKLTVEPFPRLSIVRTVAADGARYAGPFGSRSAAEAAVAAVHEVLPLRQCLERLSPTRPRSACALADMGRCGAPCTGAQSVDDYAACRRPGRPAAGRRHPRPPHRPARADGRPGGQQRFEDAQVGPRPARRPGARHLPAPAPRPARPDPRARRGAPLAARRVGGRLRPARTARRYHHLAAWRRPDALHRGAAGECRGRRGTGAAAAPPPRRRRARRSCAGWSRRGFASSRSRARGPAPSGGPPRCAPSWSPSRPPVARSPGSPGPADRRASLAR